MLVRSMRELHAERWLMAVEIRQQQASLHSRKHERGREREKAGVVNRGLDDVGGRSLTYVRGQRARWNEEAVEAGGLKMRGYQGCCCLAHGK